MGLISDKAIISEKASIGNNVSIGHYSVINDNVKIEDNVEIHTSAIIHSGTTLSKGVRVFHSAVIGSEPQDLKFQGEDTVTVIGENTVIREFCTITRGTKASGKTVVGRNSYLMSYVHIPHDSVIGNNVIIANSVNMGGHVEIGDWAIIGGLAGIHQFVKIGEHSFIAFSSRVTQDVPPYVLAGGKDFGYMGLNIVGLKRRGFDDKKIKSISRAYDIIYGDKYNVRDALKFIKENMDATQEISKIIEFIEKSERGIIRKKRNDNSL
ncbi:MAG: acyl-ACP--UDP-N-acetylglucosamine O-acyltransferase [Ignavibacteria bacterium]|nr:acyl-ACP--UDP-N-acetylglucosamine O-acyltransferase [Ignavibacteria bacterium]